VSWLLSQLTGPVSELYCDFESDELLEEVLDVEQLAVEVGVVESVPVDDNFLEDGVVIVGGGRMGSTLAVLFQRRLSEWVMMDLI
jgi:hypothetical protein